MPDNPNDLKKIEIEIAPGQIAVVLDVRNLNDNGVFPLSKVGELIESFVDKIDDANKTIASPTALSIAVTRAEALAVVWQLNTMRNVIAMVLAIADHQAQDELLRDLSPQSRMN